jgi:hypothetical protein
MQQGQLNLDISLIYAQSPSKKLTRTGHIGGYRKTLMTPPGELGNIMSLVTNNPFLFLLN